MKSLDELAVEYNTDKHIHGYCPHYETHFDYLRHEPTLLMLEVGVASGASLRMWADYFDKGYIMGVDIEPLSNYSGPRYSTIIGDIKELDFKYQYDIIIDDASHIASDIVDTYSKLWGNVRPGGWYVIEDLAVQWNRPDYGSDHNGSIATIVIDNIIHGLLSGLVNSANEIHIYDEIIFIKKGQ